MHRFDCGLGLRAATDVRLVRGHDEHIASRMQREATFRDSWQKLKFRHAARRIRLPLPHNRCIQRAIPVEKHSQLAVFLDREA